jgi:hypothetical protein
VLPKAPFVAGAVETWTLYVTAPETEVQLSVGEVDVTVAFSGDTRDGAAGSATVVKLHMPDHAPVPPAFVAFTSQ